MTSSIAILKNKKECGEITEVITKFKKNQHKCTESTSSSAFKSSATICQLSLPLLLLLPSQPLTPLTFLRTHRWPTSGHNFYSNHVSTDVRQLVTATRHLASNCTDFITYGSNFSPCLICSMILKY